MIKKTFAIALAISAHLLYGQQQQPIQMGQNDYLPPTPTAAALGKYVDQPVNLHMGIPEISIPVYEIDLGDYKLPLALSYHAGGFRVSEGASWVGLGWSVTGIGVINHSIQGLEDLDENSPISYLAFKKTEGGENVQHLKPDSEQDYPWLMAIARRDIDPAPDVFVYSFGGNSGKFILTGNGSYTLHPIKPIKVEYPQVYRPESFLITDETGVKHHFGAQELSISRAQYSTSRMVSSYFVDNITTPTNKQIDFHYVETSFQQSLSLSSQAVYERTGNLTFSEVSRGTSAFAQYLYGKAVSTITWEDGTIQFVSDTIRQDVVGDRRLTAIIVTNKNGKVIKQMEFAYDYFNPNGAGPIDKRLKLLSITEKNLSGGQDGVYTFTYNESVNLPDRTSFAIDHWGYYNGQTRNADAIPDMDMYETMDYSKRATNPATVSANVLTKIVYPTKGSTTFEYEANQTTGTSASQTVTHNVIGSAPVYNPVDGTKTERTYFYFTVDDGFQLLNFTASTVQPANVGSHQHASVSLYREGDPIPIYSLGSSGSQSELQSFSWLNLGGNDLYYFVCEVLGDEGGSAVVSGAYTTIETSARPAYCGGIRVKKITQIGGLDNKDLVKSYDYTVNSKSTGVLLSGFPEYKNSYFRWDPGQAGTSWYCHPKAIYECRLISSNDVLPSGQGGIIGYSTVTEIIGPAGEGGKNVYKFTNEVATRGTDISWRQGLLLSKLTYNRNNVLVHSLVNTYTIDSRVGQTLTGGQIDFLGGHYCAEYNVYNIGYPVYYRVWPLTLTSEWQYLSETREADYGVQKDTAAALTAVRTTRYTYGNTSHQQITRTESFTDNDIEKQVTELRYPHDLAYTPLISRHQLSAPMQKADLIEKNGGLRLINLESTVYGAQSAGTGTYYLPVQKWRLEQRVPAAYAKSTDPDFIETYTFPACSTGTAAPCLRQLIQYGYDKDLNPNALTLSNGMRRALLWGYATNQLIANAENAAPAQIAYTSFEKYAGITDLGNWTMNAGTISAGGKTGTASASGITLVQSKLPVGQYTVSFFAKGSGSVRIYNGPTTGTPVQTITVSGTAWKLYSATLTVTKITTDATLGDIGTVSVSGDAAISVDEARLLPAGARMSTYTHIPGAGVNDITDVNNMTQYYFYDGLNRLMMIRDDANKVLSTYRYGFRKTELPAVGAGGDETTTDPGTEF